MSTDHDKPLINLLRHLGFSAGGPCHCGCGEVTGPRAYFRPGHDAKLDAELRRVIRSHLRQTEQENTGTLLTTFIVGTSEGSQHTHEYLYDDVHTGAAESDKFFAECITTLSGGTGILMLDNPKVVYIIPHIVAFGMRQEETT